MNCFSTSGYLDIPLLISRFKNKPDLIFLSLNVRSLPNKFESIRELISELEKNNVNIILIALQEIWNFPHPDLLKINNFDFFYKMRNNSYGGGVGYYIRKTVNPKNNQELSIFNEKVFECLAINFTLNNQKFTVSNFYRPPNNDAESVNTFFENFEDLRTLMQRNDNLYFIFCDANINFLKINHCSTAYCMYKNCLVSGV